MFYANVRTVAILTETPSVCNGMFFYKSDSQETDIEWLSNKYNISHKAYIILGLQNRIIMVTARPQLLKSSRLSYKGRARIPH
ncbi:unnamed protein product [Clonostachys byssicola]|uniref:Uncharacterized protein n=1 Tax=Clonostachys byssicola TaxID=160290 RepID=A0A9N9Y5Z8_9HYPO|nr:unnamed protein product [Clonostachys byssicola]